MSRDPKPKTPLGKAVVARDKATARWDPRQLKPFERAGRTIRRSIASRDAAK